MRQACIGRIGICSQDALRTSCTCDGLGLIDLVENSAHQKDLVDELGNEFLPGVSQFLYRTVAWAFQSTDSLSVASHP